MKTKKEILKRVSPEHFVNQGFEKEIYKGEDNTFVGHFKKTRRMVSEGTYIDVPRKFQERENFIKALYYVNNLAALLMPGVVRHIKQSGVTEKVDDENAEYVFASEGFINKSGYRNIDPRDARAKKARELFSQKGFHFDKGIFDDNLAERPGSTTEAVYTDTVAPWWYKIQGIAYEHTSTRGGITHGIGGFEQIYEPTALYDKEKIGLAIEELTDPHQKTEAKAYLVRLEALLAAEKKYWDDKKKASMPHEDSFWEEVEPYRK